MAPNEAFRGLYGAPEEESRCHPLKYGRKKRVESGRRNEGGAFKTCSRVLKRYGAVHAWGSGSARSLEPASEFTVVFQAIAFLSHHRISFNQNGTNKVRCCL